ncbi:flagellar biosynthetic protein FliR [Sphingosinicella sp. BN140058]|uniref:flagellar biosynthetic protein FliR n=1 Tax=Sphingosinicella sp. BN140058 TaxID=1892855 RepID=UPI00101368B4|nr:flagellar biosynthetic protein FliR [Sphingosinicella sp. BN140058]QAY76623.1 flagellar biosynthetic protein FliR [Sphingosinicella sp. BN140058]
MENLPADATAFLILFARVGAVLMLLPVFSEESVPPRARLMIALGISAGMWPIISPKVSAVTGNFDALPAIIIAEVMVGLAMGMIVKIMFSAVSIAGAIVSMQVGLSSALINDPAMGGMSPVLGRFVAVAAAVVCMSMGVHHLWIASLVKSYGAFPVGGLPPAEDFARLAVQTTTNAMALAMSLAAPLIVYGIIFNVSLGLAARVAPSIQVFFIAQPLNLLLGIALFAGTLGIFLTTFAETMATWMRASWG